MAEFNALTGFREFYPEECAQRNFIFNKLRSAAKLFGFEEYDSPILEPTELFTVKSGEEIVAQLFNFEDKGGRQVALRPEMTPSLARMIGKRAKSMKKPIKWFSIAEFFRYERPQKGRLRAFYQFNADLIGDASVYADAEVIALGIHALSSFGLNPEDFCVKLSDRKLWVFFLQALGVPQQHISTILRIIDKAEREGDSKTLDSLSKISDINSNHLFKQISELKSIKSTDEFLSFLDKNRAFREIASDRVTEFSTLVRRLEEFGLSNFITIDFGIVRGLAYYTGIVFEIFEKLGKSRALAGGGRYDDLIGKLGYQNFPAVGFAIGDVTLDNILKEKHLTQHSSTQIDCFVIYSENTRALAMQQVIALRKSGICTDYCLSSLSFPKQIGMASQRGANFAVIFGEEEAKSGHAKLKNMKSGAENLVKIDRIVEILSKNAK